jgi:hypothetical protein
MAGSFLLEKPLHFLHQGGMQNPKLFLDHDLLHPGVVAKSKKMQQPDCLVLRKLFIDFKAGSK